MNMPYTISQQGTKDTSSSLAEKLAASEHARRAAATDAVLLNRSLAELRAEHDRMMQERDSLHEEAHQLSTRLCHKQQLLEETNMQALGCLDDLAHAERTIAALGTRLRGVQSALQPCAADDHIRITKVEAA